MPEREQEPAVEELAAIEAELPEWDLLAVQDYWAAVIEEELEAAEPEATSYRWPAMGPGERQLRHRARRRTGNSVLRSVAEAASTSGDSEVAA